MVGIRDVAQPVCVGKPPRFGENMQREFGTRRRAPERARGEAVVEFLDVWKRYGTREILAGVNLSIFRGEVLCILGPSGTGKSVALRHINGLTKPDAGDVRVFGESIVPLSEEQLSPVRRRLAMLFQGGALFDSMTVGENVGYRLFQEGELAQNEIERIVLEKLGFVGRGEGIAAMAVACVQLSS